jgi:hypothetical protein
MRMAASDDPEAAAELERQQARDRMERIRGGANVRSITRSITMGVDAIAKEAGADPPSKRHRPTSAEIEHERFLTFVNTVDMMPDYSDAALDLLTTEERAEAIEVLTRKIIGKIIDRLKVTRHRVCSLTS